MSMQLTLAELKSVIREAVGDRGYPGDKVHMICYVLWHAGRPLTRPEVMQQVHSLEGKDPVSFKPTSNVSYWAPATRMKMQWQRNEHGQLVQDPETPGRFLGNYEEVPNDVTGPLAQGVLVRGLVKDVGKRGNSLLYTVTEKVEQFAKEADEWMKSRPDLFPPAAD